MHCATSCGINLRRQLSRAVSSIQPDHFRLSYGQDTGIVEEGLRRVSSALDALSAERRR